MINFAPLHPLLVHLPIGIFILAAALYMLKRWRPAYITDVAIKLTLIFGLFFTLLSAGTGLWLSNQSSYPAPELNTYLVLAIIAFVMASMLVLGYVVENERHTFWRPYLFVLLVISTIAVGHFGGTLTHGADYLFTLPQSSFDSGDSISTIANIQTTEHIVEIKQMKFIPDYIDVAKGDRITFINKDVVAHDVTELKDRKWTSSTLEAGDSWTMTATKDEDYFCSLHIIMEGKIRIIK